MTDIPKVRFKGFTCPWKQRKLRQVSEKVTQKNGDMQYIETFTNSAEYGIISQRDFFDRDISNIKNIDNYYVVENDTFVYNPRISTSAPVGPINRNKLGRTGIVSPLYTAFKTHDINTEYLEWFFKSNCWHQFMYSNGNSGARFDRLSINNTIFFDMPIPVPDIKEQRKVGAFLTELDNYITFHQRKCDEMKELKRYMLKKMFPQNGKKVPEIRFAGFTDYWEQRKLSEIADKVIEKNKSNEFPEPFTNSAELGIVSQKDYFDREVVNQENLYGYYVVRNNDFVYNPRISVTAPVGPINRNRLGRNGVMSPLYTVFRTHGIDNLYLEFYFKTASWHRFMKLNGDSGARFDRFTISSTKFMEMPIPFPNKEEQRKIGEYFDNLDHLITLHQRKCDELKEVKKFMLQNMFPQKG